MRATLQLGASSTPYLATPALPAILAEVRAIVAASDSTCPPQRSFDIVPAAVPAATNGTAAVGGGGADKGMRIEPAMSARKSSQKKMRKSREKEVSRALAAADAAAASAAGSSGSGVVAGRVVNAADGGAGSGGIWPGDETAVEAACAGLSCLTHVVLCCKAHLPLGSRLAVEDVLHQGLGILARATGGKCGSRLGGEAGRGGRVVPMGQPRVAGKFVRLAHACLVTPLVGKMYQYCTFY